VNYAKLLYDGKFYSCKGATSIEMGILGSFLSSDVGCMLSENGSLWSSFGKWALKENWRGASGNITMIEKENDYIYLSDLYSEEKEPTELKMMVQEFVKLLDDWQEQVCKHKPQEVIIKEENGQFSIETKAVVDIPTYKGIDNIRKERFDCDFFLYSPEQATQKISDIIRPPRSEATEVIFNIFQDNELFIGILRTNFIRIWEADKNRLLKNNIIQITLLHNGMKILSRPH
jgi:hypothetical protein